MILNSFNKNKMVKKANKQSKAKENRGKMKNHKKNRLKTKQNNHWAGIVTLLGW